MKKYIVTLFILMFAISVNAQDNEQLTEPLPHMVENLELRDLRNKPTHMPYWGDKNMLIFSF